MSSDHCTALVFVAPVIYLTFILMGVLFQSSNLAVPFSRAHLEAQRLGCFDSSALKLLLFFFNLSMH